MRSSDIATRCREIALRVQCSGEWGELAETLTQAATEVERLRAEKAADWKACCESARLSAGEIMELRSEVERLRLSEEERESVQRTAAFLTKLAARHGGGE